MLDTFYKYMGTGIVVAWFLTAWIYLFLKEEKKQNRILFVYMPLVVLLFFFNPLFYGIFGNLTEEAIYFRFLWLLPITVVIAYTMVVMMFRLVGKKRAVFGVVCVLMIMLSGKLVYTNPLFEKAQNPYHVPQEVVEICDMIKVDGREVMAAFPQEFLLYVRQYSPYVCMPYGRDAMKYHDAFFALMEKEEIDVKKLAKEAKARGCHYVIISEEKEMMGSMLDYEYEIFGQVGEYIIYCDTSIYRGL